MTLRDAKTGWGRFRPRVVPQASLLLWLLLLASPAAAKLQISVDVGFEGKFRGGKWTPLFITLQETSGPRDVVVELYAPSDRRYAMKIRQRVTIGPQPVLVPLYAPLSYRLDETNVVVYDAKSGRRLENLPLSNTPAYFGQGAQIEVVSPNNLFVLISGSPEGTRPLASQFFHQNISRAILPPLRLPSTPVGYEAIDLLVLNQPDLNRLTLEQQQAIADWVRAGGLLVMWPGAEPPPTSGPLFDILPARIGPNRQFDLDPAAVRNAGLAPRFAKVKGRNLLDVAPDARPINLFGDAGPVGARRWVGLGQVAMLPIDLSQLDFGEPKQANDFWRTTLAGLTAWPRDGEANSGGSWRYIESGDGPARAAAMRQTLDWIGDVPGAGRFGFSNVAVVLLAMMFIVGPVDWYVLKRLGRQPWTWVTISGWIGLVTIGSIYLGHVFKSGDVYFRTASLIDEAGGARVAAVDVAGIYSPQTTDYDVEQTPESWWRTAASVNPYGGGSNLLTEIPCHQDYAGNRLLPMLINVWNIRFVEGQELTAAPPIIQAQLRLRPDATVAGTITNRAAFPITNIRVRTRVGVSTMPGTIEPGATMQFEARKASDPSFTPTTQLTEQEYWSMYQQVVATSQPTARTSNGLADKRWQRLEQQLQDRDDVAVVYAEYENPPDRVKLNGVGDAKTAHVGVVRALVPIE